MSERPKLRPIEDRITDGDGYRGDKTVGWQLIYGKKKAADGSVVVFEEFATYCVHCLQGWGWTLDIRQARLLHRAMKKHGCPRCKKNLQGSKKKS